MKYNLLILSLIFAFSCNLSKKSYKIKKDKTASKYANTITSEELKSHLSVIASDEYEGRETGRKGQRMTAQYLKNEFIKDGILPGNNGSYFQKFPLEEISKPEANFVIHNNEFQFLKDFYYYQSYTNIESFQLKINFNSIINVGLGIQEEGVNNYKNVEVKGKAVIIKLDKLEGFHSWDWKKRLSTAKNNGATMVFFTSKDFESNKEKLNHYLNKSSVSLVGKKSKKETIPFFFISDEIEKELLMVQPQLEEELARYPNFNILELNVLTTSSIINSSNVLGFIEGSDPELKNEIVILTAHYDHLGIIEGVVYNGADDDGTGTVALLELAEAFQKAKNEGNGPKRSILIMPVSGEEKGLLGSKYYTENPVFPLSNSVVDLNIDMIGRLDKNHKKDNYVYVIGADKICNELHYINEAANKTYTKLDLDYTFNDEKDPNRFYYRSDHYNFAAKGIPVIFYFSGVHEDYHKSTDEIDKIMFDKVEHITKLVFYTAWEIANKPARLKVD